MPLRHQFHVRNVEALYVEGGMVWLLPTTYCSSMLAIGDVISCVLATSCNIFCIEFLYSSNQLSIYDSN